jgi:hypothetical protein
MAAKLLLPGYGGRYVSDTVDLNSTEANVDTIDMSLCNEFTIQISHVSGTPAGTIQPQQSINGSDWADLGGTINVATDGTATKYEATDGPFGLMRFNPTNISAGAVNYAIVGYAR